MRVFTYLVSLALIFCANIFAQKSAKIISQVDAPVKIISYEADYQKRGTYTSEGIRHDIKYQNVSLKQIIAVQIGLVSFDIWNEFLDRTGGVSMEKLEPNEAESGAWIATAYADFTFYTGVAYVGKVRFSDGIIWEADLDAIASEMKKIEKDFDVSSLKGKEDGNK